MENFTYLYRKCLIVLLGLILMTSCKEEEDPCADKAKEVVQAIGVVGEDGHNVDQSSDESIKSTDDCETDEPDPTPDPDPDPDPVGDITNIVSDYIVDIVDGRKNNDELGKYRSHKDYSRGDSCHIDLENKTRFADSIAYFVNELSYDQKVQLQPIASYYGMESTDTNYVPVSFFSHPLCRVTKETLGVTIKDVPGSITVGLAQRFANEYNTYRDQYLSGNSGAMESMQKLWGTFFGCLAYTESLTTADTSKSYSVAEKYAAANYRKPAGVKFYEDPYQDEASRLNIGLFQFTPTYSGNIIPCIKQWNHDYPGCTIDKGNRQEMIPYLGSSLQHFNSFCGVHKLLQTFAIQVNSVKQRNTHPDNHSGSGNISSDKRCVTPHFYSGWAYNHYGPLQNSTGSNMNELLRCIYPEE